MLGTANEFDLDAENPSAHVSLGGESDFDIERDAFLGEDVQSNIYVSSEEESIISDVSPAKQSKFGVVAFVCFVAFVSLIAVIVSMFDIIRFSDMHI